MPHETFTVKKTLEEELAEIDKLTINDIQHTNHHEYGMSKENQEELYAMWGKERKQMAKKHGIKKDDKQTKEFMSPKKAN